MDCPAECFVGFVDHPSSFGISFRVLRQLIPLKSTGTVYSITSRHYILVLRSHPTPLLKPHGATALQVRVEHRFIVVVGESVPCFLQTWSNPFYSIQAQ